MRQFEKATNRQTTWNKGMKYIPAEFRFQEYPCWYLGDHAMMESWGRYRETACRMSLQFFLETSVPPTSPVSQNSRLLEKFPEWRPLLSYPSHSAILIQIKRLSDVPDQILYFFSVDLLIYEMIWTGRDIYVLPNFNTNDLPFSMLCTSSYSDSNWLLRNSIEQEVQEKDPLSVVSWASVGQLISF